MCVCVCVHQAEEDVEMSFEYAGDGEMNPGMCVHAQLRVFNV